MITFKRIPQHIGIIPDGNRRWAQNCGLHKKDGYKFGIEPGLELYDLCLEIGIKELTFYGFTIDNTKRPAEQIKEFQKACVKAVEILSSRDADLLVVGNINSPMFPLKLLPYTKRTRFGQGLIKINFLINYDWKWDLKINASKDISRIDLILRWGGRQRLSGFLPIQSVYADIYVVDEMWPDYNKQQAYQALSWYQDQDITLGG